MSEQDNTKEELSDYEKNIREEAEKLAVYRNALAEELQGKTLEDPETVQIAKETVLDLVPDAALTVRYLIKHAESEAIRKDLAKWIMDLAMQHHKKTTENEELENLIKELTGPTTPQVKDEPK